MMIRTHLSHKEDAIVAQLAAIIAQLDSLLALKDDVAAIKRAWMDDKKPRDEPQGPLLDPVKEEAPDDSLSDDVVGSEHVLGVVWLTQGPYSESHNQKVLGVHLVVNVFPLNTMIEYLDQILAFTHNRSRETIEVRNFSPQTKRQIAWGQLHDIFETQICSFKIVHADLKCMEVNRQTQSVLVQGWVYEAGQPTIEWLIAWYTNSFLCDLRTSHISGMEVLISVQQVGSTQ